MPDMIANEGQGQMGDSTGPGGEQNPGVDNPSTDHPIITALQDIAKFIAEQQKDGNPKATEMMACFQKLVETMQPGEAANQEQPANGQPAPAEQGVKSMSPGGVNRRGSSMPMQGQGMNPGKNSVPVL